MTNSERLCELLKADGILEPHIEYRFHPTRKWLVDLAYPRYKLAIEIEGGVYTNGRHVRPSGFINDIEKYNALTMAGWRLLRYTPQMIDDGTAVYEIQLALLDAAIREEDDR